jgi:hypothetical protein
MLIGTLTFSQAASASGQDAGGGQAAVKQESAQKREKPRAPEQLLAEARPHLEAVLGVRLDRLPQVKMVGPEDLRRLPQPGLEAEIRWQFPDLHGDSLASALTWARRDWEAVTVAVCPEGGGPILVQPDILPRIAGWDTSLARVDSPGFLQLALVRETARSVLERRYSLAALRAACRDADSYLALEALIEGRVLQVTQQVAARLGLEACFPLLAGCMLQVPDTAPDSGVRAVTRQALQKRYWACVRGLAFFNALEGRGLRDAERQVFTAPPRQLTWIERPELYLRARQAHRPELSAVLARLESSLPPARWRAAQQPLPPAMVRQVAVLLGERDRAEKVLAAWDEGRSLVWTAQDNPTRQIALSVVRLENPVAARAYFGFAVDLQRKSDSLMGSGCTSSMRVLESRSIDVTLQHAEEAVRSEKRLQFASAPAPVTTTTLLARAGDLVIECTWHGVPADPAWARRIVEACFKSNQ